MTLSAKLRYQWTKPAIYRLLLRLVLGVVFVYAGVIKLRQPWYIFAGMIDNYRLIPPTMSEPIARITPSFEVLLGVTILGGVFRRLTSTVATGMLLTFFALMLQAYLRGLQIDCGCFGAGQTLGPRTLLRDGILVTASLSLTFLSWKSDRPNSTEYANGADPFRE